MWENACLGTGMSVAWLVSIAYALSQPVGSEGLEEVRMEN